MKIKTLFFSMILCLLSAVLFSCKKEPQPVEKQVYALNYSAVEMDIGETTTLEIQPKTDENVSWYSTNLAVASVEEGVVSAHDYGETTITATVADQTLSCEVKVSPREENAFYFDIDVGDVLGEELSVFVGSVYEYELVFVNGSNAQEVDVDKVSLYTSDDSIVKLEKGDGAIVKLTGLTCGSAFISASYKHDGKTYYSNEYKISVSVDEAIVCDVEQIDLFAPKGLAGNATAVDKCEKSVDELEIYYYSQTLDKLDRFDLDALSFSTSDSAIAVVEEGKIKARSFGRTNLIVETDIGTKEIPLLVYSPISSAADLDVLAMSTYTETVKKSQAYMAGYYKFTNDIDYGTHVRNYILPIAPVMPVFASGYLTNGAKTRHILWAGTTESDSSFYSLGWKDVLGLEEAVAENGGKYLVNADGSEFRGINPNGLHFTGVIDGNGYAIKNAWYMYDNYIAGGHGSSVGFVGINDGTIENLEMNVSVPNWYTMYNNGKYKYQIDHYGFSMGWDLFGIFRTLYGEVGTVLKADGTTHTFPKHGENGLKTGTTERGGLVVLNATGTVQNIKYNVTYRGAGDIGHYFGSPYDATAYSAPTSLVNTNASVLKDCVVSVTYARTDGEAKIIPTAVRWNWGNGNITLADRSVLQCNQGSVENVYTIASCHTGTAHAVYDSTGGTEDAKSLVVYADAAAVFAALEGLDTAIWDYGDGTALPTLKRN